MTFVVGGIAVPPLLFGVYANISGSSTFEEFGDPYLVLEWILFGAPMYVLPIIMVMVLKRFMTTSWPIRMVNASSKDDSTSRNLTEFRYDIYLLVCVLSFAISSIPLFIYEKINGEPISLFWTLTPTAAAVCLAVLIDVDVVHSESAKARREISRWDFTYRALGLGFLLGGIVSWLTTTITEATPAQFVVYATTAACIGIVVGSQSHFRRNIKRV